MMTRDPGDTLPLFPGADFTAPARWAAPDEVGTVPMFTAPAAPEAPAEPTMRHAPEPGERCDWPDPCADCMAAGDPDDCERICGRPAVVVYIGRPTPSAAYTAEYPRCKRHDTVAAQRRADADGWTRRPVAQEDPA